MCQTTAHWNPMHHLVKLIAFLALCVPHVTPSDVCTCNHLTCDTPTNCSHGLVLDQCGCCIVCARRLGEPCGGADNPGVCGRGLQCVVKAKPGDRVTGMEQGVCQAAAEFTENSKAKDLPAQPYRFDHEEMKHEENKRLALREYSPL